MMLRGLGSVLLLVCSNAFMTLAWYGQIMFKSRLERFGVYTIVVFSWLIAFFEYCLQVPANRLGSVNFGGPFNIWELKVIQEVISCVVFGVIVSVLFKGESLQWNHLVAVLFLILAVYFVFMK